MTTLEKVKEYLEVQPLARERKNHGRAMVNLLLQRYPEFKEIKKETLVEFCKDFETYTRAWRAVTERNPSLQGADYLEKQILEENKMLELGYEVGYNQPKLKI